MSFTIRPATEDDAAWLSATYLQMLGWLDGQEYLFLPTEANALTMVSQIFIPAIRDGRSGIFIVEDEEAMADYGDTRIAVLYWVVEAAPLQLRFPTATSYGQWVYPAYRGHQLVPKMVFHASQHFRAAGVGQVIDMAHDPEAIEAAKSAGFEVDSKVLVLKFF